MRKVRWLIAAVFVFVMGSVGFAAGELYQGYPIVKVIVDGKTVTSDVPAIVFNNRTVLPVRAIADALNVGVGWDQATQTVTLTSKTPVATDPGAPIFQFSGTGQSVSKLMTLSTGAYIVKMTHKGQRNFAVTAHTSAGGYVALLANTIGSFDGSKLLAIDSDGKYLLDITADGDWTITVSPAQ